MIFFFVLRFSVNKDKDGHAMKKKIIFYSIIVLQFIGLFAMKSPLWFIGTLLVTSICLLGNYELSQKVSLKESDVTNALQKT